MSEDKIYVNGYYAQDVEVQTCRKGKVSREVRVDKQSCTKSHAGAVAFARLGGRRVCPSKVRA